MLTLKQGIYNKGKKDKGNKHDIQLVIASEDTAKALDSAKQTLNLIALPVKGFVIVPRLLAVGFRRDNRYVTKLQSKLAGSIPLIGPVHQQIDLARCAAQAAEQFASLGSVTSLPRGQGKPYSSPVRCGNHMKFCVPSTTGFPD